MAPQLQWKMERVGTTLRIGYTVSNPGDAPIWLVDDLLARAGSALARAPAAAIVRQSAAADTVSFYRGMLHIPTREQRKYPAPGVREIAAGQSLSATLETELPLAAWHNYHPKKMKPLAATPAKAVLELQYLDSIGGPDDSEQITLADGSVITAPYLRFLNEQGKLLRSQPEPLPGD